MALVVYGSFICFNYAELPAFAKEIENATVPVGREAILSCVIYNLGSYKVRLPYPRPILH